MIDLIGLDAARGLSPDERDRTSMLLEVFRKNYDRNVGRMDYYRGRVAVKNLGIAVPESLSRGLSVSCCWPQKTVEALQQRSVFDGFVSPDGTVSDALANISRRNDLYARYSRAVIPQLVHGCVFATVSPKGGRATIRFRTADMAAALWNGEDETIDCGFAVIDSKRYQGDTQWSPSLVNLYLAHDTIQCRRNSKEGEWEIERAGNSLGRPMMEPLVYRRTEDKPFGQSRITRPVMALTDAYMREMLRLEVGAEMFTSPQKAILGADEDTLAKDKLTMYLTNLLLIPKDDDGDVPRLEQLGASTMQPHTEVMRMLAAQFAGATSVPLNELGVVADNPSSADAIYAAKEALVTEVQNVLNASNAVSLRNVAAMAQAIDAGKSMDELSPEQVDVVANFKNPAMPSIAQQADAMVKLAGVCPDFAGTPVFWEQVGFAEDTRRKIEGAISQTQNRAALLSMMGGGNGGR